MIDLETINSMWEKDSKIDDIMLDQSTIKIPQLHQKYLSLHGEFKLLLAKKNSGTEEGATREVVILFRQGKT